MNTAELIQRIPGLTDEQRQAFLGACSTRGKHKGYLLSKGNGVAWQVLVGYLAPARAGGVTQAWLENDEARAWRRELEKAAVFSHLGSYINATEPACRWNLWAHRYDRLRALERIETALKRIEK